MTPVLGVTAVTNPVPADGASDAETLDDMRTAAPQSIRTLDRVVSLADFEAFTRSYRGIGKALATELHDGMRSVVCLTIATTALVASPGTDLVDGTAQGARCGRACRAAPFASKGSRICGAGDGGPRGRSRVPARGRRGRGADGARHEVQPRAARRFGEALHRSAVIAAVQDGRRRDRGPAHCLHGRPAGRSRSTAVCCRRCRRSTATNFDTAGLLSIDPGPCQFAEMLP